MKSDANPMQKAQASPRCTAHSKRTGLACKNPAVRGWRVCRMHGARGGHAAGPTHPAWTHGERSQKAVAARKEVSALIRELREIEAMIDQ